MQINSEGDSSYFGEVMAPKLLIRERWYYLGTERTNCNPHSMRGVAAHRNRQSVLIFRMSENMVCSMASLSPSLKVAADE